MVRLPFINSNNLLLLYHKKIACKPKKYDLHAILFIFP